MKALFCIVFVFVLILFDLHAAVPQQTLTFEALYSFSGPRDLDLSADGRLLVYTVTRTDVATNSSTSAVRYFRPIDVLLQCR